MHAVYFSSVDREVHAGSNEWWLPAQEVDVLLCAVANASWKRTIDNSGRDKVQRAL